MQEEEQTVPTHKFALASNLNRIFLAVVALSIVAGLATGYTLASNTKKGVASPISALSGPPKTAGQDTRTFRDFAEGKITKKPTPKNPAEYTEGTHLLIRDAGVPVALTSSVVDLSEFEGKKAKVYGETQKAVKEGWLMDVGKVEVE